MYEINTYCVYIVGGAKGHRLCFPPEILPRAFMANAIPSYVIEPEKLSLFDTAVLTTFFAVSQYVEWLFKQPQQDYAHVTHKGSRSWIPGPTSDQKKVAVKTVPFDMRIGAFKKVIGAESTGVAILL